MKKTKLFALVAGAMVLVACGREVQTASYSVIPQPQEVALTDGEGFKLNGSTTIAYPASNEALKLDAEHLAGYLKQLTGHDLKVTDAAPDKNVIALNDQLGSENPEGYVMTVSADRIDINGTTAAGTFYGIQTLRKSILEAKNSDVVFPAATITDEPRFSYRGAMLDVSRHFFPVDSVKAFLDILALHNINNMHWHLSDDQGWRVEIKSRPLLTEVGSKRAQTVIGHNSGEYDSIPYGGFYTQDEIRDIIAYAADRHINIVPEIDLPGHMMGALAAYPYLGCTGGPYKVWEQWGISDDVLCAGNDSTYAFLDDVLGEIVELFPSEYIHVGGDECPKTRWASCPTCQAKIKELGLKADEHGTKEEKLQSHVIHHASDFLASKGRKMIGWDETIEGGLAPGAIVMSWRGEGPGREAARLGHDVIMTPTTNFYFDYYQTLDRENEPLAIGGYLPVKRVYEFEPVPAGLAPEEGEHIIGVQANIWTEYIPTFSHVEYMALPRMAALSEVQWTNAPKDYNEFASRIPQLINQYKANGYNYAKHIFNVNGTLTPNPDEHAIVLELSTIDNAPVYYTLDGTEPTTASTLYEGPVTITESAMIKAAANRDNQMEGIYTDSVGFSKATAAKVDLLTTPASRYKAKEGVTLTDGKFGASTYSTGDWVGFNGEDMVAVVDFGKAEKMSELSLRTCVVTGDWVFDTTGIEVLVSNDGTNFTQVASEEYPLPTQHVSGVMTHTVSFPETEAQYVKVIAKSVKSMPDWHAGAGKSGYIFVDEISIN